MQDVGQRLLLRGQAEVGWGGGSSLRSKNNAGGTAAQALGRQACWWSISQASVARAEEVRGQRKTRLGDGQGWAPRPRGGGV